MFSKELVAASSRPLVLSVLRRGESYGYAILQEVRVLSGGALEWSEGMLYPVLHRLEKEKLIASRWRVAETGRRRRYYTLTAKGQRQLDDERRSWLTMHDTLTRAWEMGHV